MIMGQGMLQTVLAQEPAAEEAAESLKQTAEPSEQVAESSEQAAEPIFGQTVQAGSFAVTVPDEIIEISDIETGEKGIYFYEAISHETLGGFVGSILLYDNVKDYSYIPHYGRGGVIQYPDGSRLDIVLEYPSDVQFDVENPDSIDNYHKILEAFDGQIIQTITPLDDGVFIPQSEVDETAVYGEVLEKLKADLQERKDANALVEDGFSGHYADAYASGEEPLEVFGYGYVDLLGNGYPQLAILSVDSLEVYDLFAQADGEVLHLFSGSARDRYTLCGEDNGSIWAVKEELSGGADLTEIRFYSLDPGTMELYLQTEYLYDGQRNPENPYFVRYISDEEPENIPEEEWKERIGYFGEKVSPDMALLNS